MSLASVLLSRDALEALMQVAQQAEQAQVAEQAEPGAPAGGLISGAIGHCSKLHTVLFCRASPVLTHHSS